MQDSRKQDKSMADRDAVSQIGSFQERAKLHFPYNTVVQLLFVE
jgi:hypothetical protein